MRNRIRAPLLCALLHAGASGSSAAQEPSEREYLLDFPTVVSASGLRQNAMETPQAITVIDQPMIRASGVREVAELFRMVPGFTVSYVTHVKGLQPIVYYHGLGREFFSRLQVLIDGRSMNNATLGGIDWSQFPLALEDIDRIEVIRGPSNAVHGIGAFTATINFITRHATQVRGVHLSGNAGNDGILDGTLRGGSGVDSFQYRLAAGHRADDGFPGLPDSRSLDYVMGRADLQIDASTALMLQAGVTNGKNDAGLRPPEDPARSVRTQTAYALARWERSKDADNGLSVQAYYYRFELSDQYLTDPLPPFNNERFRWDDGSTVDRADLEAQQTFTTGRDLRWVWGAGLRQDRARVPAISLSSTLGIQRLFGHVEWRITDRLLLNAGAMLEHNDITGTDVAPQVALNYRFAPQHVLRFSVAKALRTPTAIESGVGHLPIGPVLRARSASSVELQPESIVSSEVSYAGEFPAFNTTVDVKAFYDTIDDLIGLFTPQGGFPPPTYPRNAINGDSARQQGIEGQLVWRPGANTTLWLSGAHVQTSSADRFDTYSTSAPRNSGHLLVSTRFGDAWDASASVQAQSAYRASVLADPQPGFCSVNLRLVRRLDWLGGGEVGFVVQNVFDTPYTEYRRNNVAQRTAWLTVRLKL
ncbi:MAG: TonB-dependent receptor [Burkholderiales bacterium]|nr:TonB-dependent receptor [Burkholderiales bacterium]